MWVSCWGCSCSLLCTGIMRNMICDCIYHKKLRTPIWADLESKTAEAKELTSKLSLFGRTRCWSRWALVCPCRTNAHGLWACISSAPEAHFLLWLSSKSKLCEEKSLQHGLIENRMSLLRNGHLPGLSWKAHKDTLMYVHSACWDGLNGLCWKYDRFQRANCWKSYVWKKTLVYLNTPSLLDMRKSSPLIPANAFLNGVF